MPYTNDDKLQWEVKKLVAETGNLSRPFIRRPSFWLGLGPLALSLGTNLVQLNSSERIQQLAEIKTASLQLDTKQLTQQKAELEAGVREQRAQLVQVAKELEQQQAALESIKTQVAGTTASREAVLRSVTALQQRATTLGGIVETTKRSLAVAGAPQRHVSTQDTGKAAQFEAQAFDALASKDFSKALQLFQASEDAANGFRYSYEWSRLLRTRASELRTPEGQRAVLQFALAKGYASYASEEVRAKLRELAQA
ncbi:hypothetical protein [Pelomonas sp. SE-A7]|uniref:hypothetical protein n=1 Tax=Pelomonas sp. SE-A7 TaxID=3054953 RepID=UPI00259C74C5|nr:hypothetical protein [Pelomonas sp. SE-A7]MDM4766565.1 hypothetical protein [Pelomonas sp. SE-A7]